MGLAATYDVPLRLIGKRIVDFLLVLIALFSLGVMVEVPRANIDRKSAKLQAEVVVSDQPFLLSES